VLLQVHVDPVVTVNGGVHISANGTQAMPLLGNLLPASAPPPPVVLLGSPDDTGDGPLPILPPVPPGGNEAYNAGLLSRIFYADLFLLTAREKSVHSSNDHLWALQGTRCSQGKP
jgi:hypothetical protein